MSNPAAAADIGGIEVTSSPPPAPRLYLTNPCNPDKWEAADTAQIVFIGTYPLFAYPCQRWWSPAEWWLVNSIIWENRAALRARKRGEQVS